MAVYRPLKRKEGPGGDAAIGFRSLTLRDARYARPRFAVGDI